MSRILDRIERDLKREKRTPQQNRVRRITMALLCIAIPLIGGELLLRLLGFYRPQIDFKAQEALLHDAVAALNARFETEAFEFDQHLLWKLKPGTNLKGLDVGPDGLLTWEKPASGPRSTQPLVVLCLGDSVSAVTYRTYPEMAESLAAIGANSRPVQIYSAAVPGYSTEQALRLLPQLKHIQPDVIVFCFGWSDHFPALSLPDRELGVSNAGTRMMHDLLKDLRLYQFMGAPLGTKLTPSKDTRETTGTGPDSRVPMQQYRENLRGLVQMARAWSATPFLATEPENLKAVSEQFLEQNLFIAPGSRDNASLHAEYNKAVRETSTELKVPLLDIEEEFVRRPRDFMLEPDGIHLTGRGHNHVARLVLGALRNEGLITPGDYDAIARAEKHDTTAPDKPKVTWSLFPDRLSIVTGEPFSFSVIPQNTGNTRWLRRNVIPRFGLEKNVPYGNTSVYARWRTIDSPTTAILQKMPLPSDVLPGEATSMTLTATAPPLPGNYEMEIGLMAEGIGLLSAYGADSTTLTVSAIPPPQP